MRIQGARIALASACLLLSQAAGAAEFILGASFNRTVFEAKDRVSKQVTGKLGNDGHLRPTYTVVAFEQSFGSSNAGLQIELGEATFQLDKQILADDREVDSGTKIIGNAWYLTPTIFYQFNRGAPASAWKTKIGLGFGLGYMDVAGTIQMTEQAGQPVQSVDIAEYTLSTGFLVELRKAAWIAQMKVYGPTWEEAPFDYQLLGISVTLGRSFEF